MYVSGDDQLFEPLCGIYGKKRDDKVCLLVFFHVYYLLTILKHIPLDPNLSNKIMGSVLPDPNVTLPGSTFPSPLESQNLPDIQDTRALSVLYYMPETPPGHIFTANLLPNVTFPPRSLSPDDIMWIKMGGGRYGNNHHRGRGRGRGGMNIHAAGRFIRHGVGADGAPYMGGGGYDVSGSRNYYPRHGSNNDHSQSHAYASNHNHHQSYSQHQQNHHYSSSSYHNGREGADNGYLKNALDKSY